MHGSRVIISVPSSKSKSDHFNAKISLTLNPRHMAIMTIVIRLFQQIANLLKLLRGENALLSARASRAALDLNKA